MRNQAALIAVGRHPRTRREVSLEGKKAKREAEKSKPQEVDPEPRLNCLNCSEAGDFRLTLSQLEAGFLSPLAESLLRDPRANFYYKEFCQNRGARCHREILKDSGEKPKGRVSCLEGLS